MRCGFQRGEYRPGQPFISLFSIKSYIHIPSLKASYGMKYSMSLLQLTRSQRLMIIIGISFSFFVAEIGGKQVYVTVHHSSPD